MPQFKVAKTDNITKIQTDLSINNTLIEDKLYIYKESNKHGRLFYIFDENTKIEIGTLDNIYTTTINLTNDIETLEIRYLQKYNSDVSLSTVDINEVQINSFVTSNKSLYNIRNIDIENNMLTLRKIYSQQDLMWNDYY